ncbi:hypothetical protein E2C01_066527 [Portunus trituberculatus]|uniref:Uncharacterized protein n=1 Tax=Portunus trituberculatus TaxID=210409 RepID=A0A5B7HR54_PORTR|nr:hypothetical protein [Portunus trituberculatus]
MQHQHYLMQAPQISRGPA